jgi:Cu(I)/Ag(I) efflux system membrane fusion protein
LEVDNPGFKLRPDMFVNVELTVSLPTGLSVPADAVVDSGMSKRVFVETSSNHFETREVETGWRLNDRVQIVKGLKEGETVVAAGTFLVDSESRLQIAANSGSSSREASQAKPTMNHTMN